MLSLIQHYSSNTKTLSTLSVKCQEGLLLSLIKISARQAPSRSQRRHEAHEKDFFSMIVLSINSALKLQLYVILISLTHSFVRDAFQKSDILLIEMKSFAK